MAATNARLAREQCEKAFANFFLNLKASPPDWCNPTPLTSPMDVPVLIRKGQFGADGKYVLDNIDEIPLPALCIAVPRVKPHPDMEYPVCELHVIIMSSVDEVNAPDLTSARIGFVAELLDISRRDDLKAALNPPASGVDPRVVQNFVIFGLYPTEDMGQEIDRRWLDHLVYEVHCVPTDDVLGLGQG